MGDSLSAIGPAVDGAGMTFYESAQAAANVATPAMERIFAAARYPKRQRAETINYAEDDDDEIDTLGSGTDHSEEGDEVLPPPSKRVKTIKSTKPLKPNKIFPFMKLPPELRNKIYHECLSSNQYDHKDRATLYFDSSTRNFRNTVKFVEKSSIGDPIGPERLYRRRHMKLADRSDGNASPGKNEPLKHLVPNLLAVSKAIYAEAGPLMYSQRFVFSDCMALHNFMAHISHRTAAFIRHVEVRQWSQRRSRGAFRGFMASAIMAAKGCTNLDSFDITSTLGNFYSWREEGLPVTRRIARKVYKDFQPWIDAVGIQAGDMYKALEIFDIGDWTFCDAQRFAPQSLSEAEEDKSISEARRELRKELKKLIANGM